MKILTKSFVLIIGSVLILSALLKLMDTGGFGEVISSYGFPYLSILAPGIVIFELLLGLHLIFFIHVRKTLLITGITLVFFTLVYSYGFFIKGIESCGCFGNFISNVIDRPLIVFVRNIILIIFAAIAYVKMDQADVSELKLKKAVIYIVIGFALFVSGYTFRSQRIFKSTKESKYLNKSTEEIGLNCLYNFSKDSTYIAFIFSYSCTHCLNTVANINLFKEYDYVDNIIYLPVGDGPEKEDFNSNYKIKGIRIDDASEEISKISVVYPTILFIKNNNIIFVNQGVISAPLVFFMKNNIHFN